VQPDASCYFGKNASLLAVITPSISSVVIAATGRRARWPGVVEDTVHTVYTVSTTLAAGGGKPVPVI
jgi:hypothetical protein